AERGEDGAVLQVGTKPADAGGDRLAGFGMAANLTRQRQQTERCFEIDILGLYRTRQGDPLRLLAILGLAELDVVAVGALLDADRERRGRVVAERRIGAAGLAFGVDAEGAGKAAFRVIRAADEGAEAAELQAQPPGAAAR